MGIKMVELVIGDGVLINLNTVPKLVNSHIGNINFLSLWTVTFTTTFAITFATLSATLPTTTTLTWDIVDGMVIAPLVVGLLVFVNGFELLLYCFKDGYLS